MIENRIGIMQSTIETTQNIPNDTKTELLNLVAGLKSEIATLSETRCTRAARS